MNCTVADVRDLVSLISATANVTDTQIQTIIATATANIYGMSGIALSVDDSRLSFSVANTAAVYLLQQLMAAGIIIEQETASDSVVKLNVSALIDSYQKAATAMVDSYLSELATKSYAAPYVGITGAYGRTE